MRTISLLSALFLTLSILPAQGFVKVTDTANAIVTFTVPADYNYLGAAWVDIDHDGDVDLFAAPDHLIENLGSGIFKEKTTDIGAGLSDGSWIYAGTSWADVDNDGDLDCLLAYASSKIYLNDGAGNFTVVNGVPFDVANTAWAGAFGDYNKDGFADFTLTYPTNSSNPNKSQIFKTFGVLSYEKIVGLEYTDQNSPHTVASWADFDDDGDFDLFVASGPAVSGSSGLDFIYKNELAETGQPNFSRISNLPFATDLQDGQSYSFIDYDNDGHLDICLANYRYAPNRLYHNNGDGTWTSVTTSFTNTSILRCLSNVWGDFDNDGDLDVIFTRDTGQKALFYLNDGAGNFTLVTNSPIAQHIVSTGASIGDYDNDGDLDVFLNGRTDTPGRGKALYRNDGLGGANHWVNFTLAGTMSNKAGIGAKIRIKAMIDGQSKWLRRDVSAQNAFQGQNDLRVHFGLGTAASIDSLLITWPSGAITTCAHIQADQFYTVVEKNGIWDMCLSPTTNFEFTDQVQFSPNPAGNSLHIEIPNQLTDEEFTFSIADGTGKLVLKGNVRENIDLSSLPTGIYWVKVQKYSGECWMGKLVKN